MNKKKKLIISVVVMNIALIFQGAFELALALIEKAWVGTLIGFCIFVGLSIWAWYGSSWVPYHGAIVSLLFVLAVLFANFSVTNSPFFCIMIGVFGFAYLSLFDAFTVKDRLDLID